MYRTGPGKGAGALSEALSAANRYNNRSQFDPPKAGRGRLLPSGIAMQFEAKTLLSDAYVKPRGASRLLPTGSN